MKAQLKNITKFLDERQVDYQVLHHQPTYTSEESARARGGEDLARGAKALLMKVDKRFILFVLSAEARLDSKMIKRTLNIKHLRFATTAELAELTGLVSGAVPPFGEPILPFSLYIDESIVALPVVAFNAASLTDSVRMSTQDYLKIAGGQIINFTQTLPTE